MKKVKSIIGVFTLGVLTLGMMSCKETKNENTKGEINVTSKKKSSEEELAGVGSIIDGYMELKDALVADDGELAKKAAESLTNTLSNLDIDALEVSNKGGVKEIIATAKENTDQIAKSAITQQREFFEGLSANLVSLVEITGTPAPLYQQFCPMYKNDQGGMWVSTVRTVKNPYFGSEMLNCGFVQKEIN